MSKFSAESNWWALPIEGPDFINGQTRYNAAMFTRLHQLVSTQTKGALDVLGEGVLGGEVTVGAGLTVNIAGLIACTRHEVYGPAIIRQPATTWPVPANSVRYLYIVWERSTHESWTDAVGSLETQTSDVYDAGGAEKAAVLLAKITSGVSSITNIQDRRAPIGPAAGDGPQSAGYFKAGPLAGSAASPTYRRIGLSDLPVLTSAQVTDFTEAARAAMSFATGAPVADLDALRAIAPADRVNGQERFVESNSFRYSFQATGTGDDDDEGTIAPDTGTGRWFKNGGGSLSDAGTLQGQDSGYYRNRANHTGTQLASTISDFNDAAAAAAQAWLSDTFLAEGSDLEVTFVGENFVTTLRSTGVVEGSYTNGNFTVNDKGQIIAAENGDPPTANATQIQGVNVSATAPTTSQVLGYDGTQWKPVTPSSGGGGGTSDWRANRLFG